MNRTAWFLCMSVGFCLSNNDIGCCGQYNNGVCGRCCINFELVNGNCQACSPGFWNVNCSMKCDYPTYGELCLESCTTNSLNCSEEDCDPVSGCLVKKTSMTSYVPQNVRTSESFLSDSSTQGSDHHSTISEKDSTIEDEDFSKMSVSKRKNTMSDRPVRTSVPKTLNTKQTTSLNTPPTPKKKAPGSVPVLTSDSWLISVVGVLGISLGVSLVIILGLVCLFLWRKRQDNTMGEQTNIKNHGRQRELETYTYSCDHMNSKEVLTQSEADVVTNFDKHSYTDSAEYQTLCPISALRKSDEKGRSEAPGKSTDTYMEPVPREEVILHTVVDNPSYIEVIE